MPNYRVTTIQRGYRDAYYTVVADSSQEAIITAAEGVWKRVEYSDWETDGPLGPEAAQVEGPYIETRTDHVAPW